MISGKQRSYLKKLANGLQPILQVGKGGINDNLIKQVNDALEARELIKATVLKNQFEDLKTICEEIAQRADAEVVQIIGHKFVLYRESKDSKVIILP